MTVKIPANPKAKLDQSELHHIQIEKSVFLKAEKLVGVPWQAMAAIWFRESFSTVPPKTPGGQFQFDPPDPSSSELKAMLKRYVKSLSDAELQEIVQSGINHFESASILAACHLRDKANFVLATNHSDDAIKDAFYGYNGRAWGPHPEDSPYVMNNFDAAHMNMRIRGTVPDGHGGKKWIDTIDHQPGAFTVYKQLLSDL